ncbi:hypothetical protein SLEP1_g18917 [Rubroshorea leprosula]|uniref:Transposase n=1 Tax=Rubroshorea leprosula TaxID=152421 RepID=A0AAV5J4M3_9ROSI|nr:hypothetical protein SLEP1_g18917 [Rubroshorea leprosula]
MSRKIAEHMTWHLKCCGDTDEVIHLTQSESWRHFDQMHPSFKRESRNVRLGLATDGFNPWAHSSTSYSCWPVLLTVYNLPPEMCMRPEFTFLILVIAGPKSPGKNIDVFLRPLIEDLKMLWSTGVETYDSYQGVTEVEVNANTSEEEEDYGEEKDSESSGNSDNVEDGDDGDDSDD